MWCTARVGNSNSTATLHKVRTLFQQLVPKAKVLPLSCAKPLQAGSPRSDLAISAKSKAKLTAPSYLFNDHLLLSLLPFSNTTVKQPTPPFQGAPLANLLAAVENFLPSGAASSALLPPKCPVSSKELPSGRQVLIYIAQGKGPTGRKRDSSVSNDSGVGGEDGANEGDEGDGDRDEAILEEEEEKAEDDDKSIKETQQPNGDNSEHIFPANTTIEGIQETQQQVSNNIMPPESVPTDEHSQIIRPFYSPVEEFNDVMDIADNPRKDGIESELGSDDMVTSTPIEETQQPVDGKTEPVFPPTPVTSDEPSSGGWWDDIDID